MDNLPESKQYTSLLSALAIALLLPISAQAADNWVNGRTADGQPDLQGLWTNDTITPMERPASMADKLFHSDDEVAAMETRIAERRAYADDNIVVEAGGNIGGYNQIWMDSGDTVLSTGIAVSPAVFPDPCCLQVTIMPIE